MVTKNKRNTSSGTFQPVTNDRAIIDAATNAGMTVEEYLRWRETTSASNAKLQARLAEVDKPRIHNQAEKQPKNLIALGIGDFPRLNRSSE